MELTELEQQRVEKLEALKRKGMEVYPRRATRTHTIAEAIAALEAAETSDTDPPSVVMTGRLRSIRTMGKISFADIEDGTGTIQLFLRLDALDDEVYEAFTEAFDLGDFVEAGGPFEFAAIELGARSPGSALVGAAAADGQEHRREGDDSGT